MSVKFLDHVEVGGNLVRFLGDPVDATDATNRRWVLEQINRLIAESGDLNTEEVQDVVATMLRGSNIAVTYDDAAGTLLLAVTDSPTVGGRNPGYLLARANHTGTQSLDTTTDSGTRIAFSPDERAKLAGVAAGATKNATDGFLLYRGNHTGTQSADTLVDGDANKAYTAAERTKLDGIAEGATRNATDAALRDRATHTGTQHLSTITGHDKAAHDLLDIDAATLDGNTADALRDRTTHTGTQSLDTTTDSATRLAMSPAQRDKLAGVATGATANETDAFLVDRANHTGTQSADTLTNGAVNKVYTAAEQAKVAGVQDGATKNATDADLRNRATHTGTQDVSTITGLNKSYVDALSINAATLNGLSAAEIEAAVTAAIVDNAPDALNTLREIADALAGDAGSITDIFARVALRNVTFAATIGDGTASTFTVAHGIGSTDVTVEVYETGGDREKVHPTIRHTSADAVTVVFGSAPGAGAYRVVVQGRRDPA